MYFQFSSTPLSKARGMLVLVHSRFVSTPAVAPDGLVFMSPLHGGTLGGVTWLFHLCKPKEYRN